MTPSPLFQLSPRARTALAEIARSGASGREVRRAQALLWLDAGESVQQVAERLQGSRQMLYFVVARYEARCDRSIGERIQDEPHSGRPATMRQRAMDALESLLATPPRVYGYRGSLWTTTMLKTQLEKQYGLDVSEDTVQRALHDRAYRFKRPRYVLARRAPFWRQAKGGSKPD